MKKQIDFLCTHFTRRQRVSTFEELTLTVRFGRIECECNERRGWYYVRFPEGDLELMQWVDLLDAPEDSKRLNWTNKNGDVEPLPT